MLKINNELERIGDLGVNIAERAVFASRQPEIHVPFDYIVMAEASRKMLGMSLDSLINRDVNCAHEVLGMDDEVDRMNADMYKQFHCHPVT